jgi:hypothetical protein
MAEVDISGWSLKLPPKYRDEIALHADQSSLASVKSRYFRTERDGSLTFIAPADGARGNRSSGTELRRWRADDASFGWNTSLEGYLSASLRINEVPCDAVGRPVPLVIGHIRHGSHCMCRLYYDAGSIYFVDDVSGPDASSRKFVLTSFAGDPIGVPQGERFDFFIRVQMTKLHVSVIYKGRTYSALDELDPFWIGKNLQFSIGVHVQSESESLPIGQGSVSYFAVSEPGHSQPTGKPDNARPESGNQKKLVSAKIVLQYDDGETVEIPISSV